MTTERYIASRAIAATPAQIFSLLSNPARHQETEPTDWVRDPLTAELITGAGQVFGMNMYLVQAGGDYVTQNLVNVFEKDRAIGWMPGQLDQTGNHRPGGWSWRYDLTPSGEGTDVTLTYDWSGTPQAFRDQIGGMPPFPEEYLAASLEALERTV